jgi:inorganic pyrophosphatase
MARSVQTPDVLLFLDDAVPLGSVATARLIGALEVEQKDQGEPWERNDRFFAVATHAHTHQALKKLDDLRPHLLPEIESFFTHYAGLNGKRLRIVRRSGPRRARKLLKAEAKAFKAKR